MAVQQQRALHVLLDDHGLSIRHVGDVRNQEDALAPGLSDGLHDPQVGALGIGLHAVEKYENYQQKPMRNHRKNI